MKTSFFQKEIKNKTTKHNEDKKFNFYLKSLIIVFILSTLFLTHLYSNVSKIIYEKTDNIEDYVSVFKESNAYDLLFSSLENE